MMYYHISIQGAAASLKRRLKISILCEEHFRWCLSALCGVSHKVSLCLFLSVGWNLHEGIFKEIIVTMTTQLHHITPLYSSATDVLCVRFCLPHFIGSHRS